MGESLTPLEPFQTGAAKQSKHIITLHTFQPEVYAMPLPPRSTHTCLPTAVSRMGIRHISSLCSFGEGAASAELEQQILEKVRPVPPGMWCSFGKLAGPTYHFLGSDCARRVLPTHLSCHTKPRAHILRQRTLSCHMPEAP